MASISNVRDRIRVLKAQVAKDSISPSYLGDILEDMIGYCIWASGSSGQHALRLEIVSDGDGFIAFGDVIHIRCEVMDIWTNVTDLVTGWKITRDTGNPVEDAAWSLLPKAKEFKGEIDIVFNESQNDLGYADKAVFTISAVLDDGVPVSASLVL